MDVYETVTKFDVPKLFGCKSYFIINDVLDDMHIVIDMVIFGFYHHLFLHMSLNDDQKTF